MSRQLRAATIASFLVLTLATATSSSAHPRNRGENEYWSLRGSMGFTASPDTFLVAFEAPYNFSDIFSLGPLLQVGINDDDTIVAASLHTRYAFRLDDSSAPQHRRGGWHLGHLRPYLQGGLGLAHIDKERRGNDRDGTAFLINMGFGADYYLTPEFALGSNMLFNILPGDAAGEKFFYSWQVLSARFDF